MPLLRPSERFRDAALAILCREHAGLRDAGVPGELVLVGGTSVPGALTRGDVDLHLRVDPNSFADAVERLRGLHPVVHPEIWQPTLATFEVAEALPTGIAVTPIGSEHDVRFTRTWAILAARPDLLAEYNAVKLAGPDASRARGTGADTDLDPGYEERKSAFFDRILAE
ncbi:GrpB family protein [Planctomonas psychrotolerans]|uniref:GrpB family protein n=1 Tax=Planctomonas psychrotolerans TaxID=2528712 RepID=UPI001239A770|nr:GrpB family protein [Planctomonas psychrotolerans]